VLNKLSELTESQVDTIKLADANAGNTIQTGANRQHVLMLAGQYRQLALHLTKEAVAFFLSHYNKSSANNDAAIYISKR